MSDTMNLERLVDAALATPRKGQRFPPLLEKRYQQDIHRAQCRYIRRVLFIGILCYESFLFCWWLLIGDGLGWAAYHMVGVGIPLTLCLMWLMPRLSPRWREGLALIPFYLALLLVYHLVIHGPPAVTANPMLYVFLFTWPLIPTYSNICLRAPLRPVLAFNAFCLAVILAGALQVTAPFSLHVLMIVNAFTLAFFSLLASYWLDAEGRRSYLYRLRDELHMLTLHSANRDLQRLSETDSLTELANRRGLAIMLEVFWRKRQDGRTGSLLLLDVDFFKPYNDHYGHLAGDSCLRRVGAAMQQALRPGDCIGRYGGEEFLVLLDAVTPSEARNIAERLLQNVRDLRIPHAMRPDGLGILTISGGLVDNLDPTARTVDELLGNADQALYRAKALGRNRFCEDGQELSSSVQLPPLGPDDLRLGLALGQFDLLFQPIYRVAGQVLAGYEALLRWQHPQRGSIPPEVFIPLAERHGLIDSLGEWALQQACQAACQWQRELTVSVNLSPVQLRDPVLPERVAAVLSATGLPGDRLILELTEGEPLELDQRTRDTFTALQALGIRLALDDFGTGHANLGYLLALKFQLLKVDQQILAIASPRQREDVLRALQQLARSLGVRLLCEGVETDEQLALLQKLGVEEAQGYWLGRPQPSPRREMAGAQRHPG
ncbi:putative bifunctional diguanylate cyclase/phosphodiesterase [Pseudomonas oryzihabitans]|uniref:putative bifunctional diguanylate cyclase/phosphodiesterase n=1 Tax=Pseudomonas oryzihabitans TaxID=47885 RepID=UPI002858D375|nr:bifunctional diguanylate cyclase/phosphodiesterase [Pseudomonas psychrotolerans]MDR6677133.1 diguanylate cyclase (GGDEF)-like protein [Pseudomonas psychrotolerans]